MFEPRAIPQRIQAAVSARLPASAIIKKRSEVVSASVSVSRDGESSVVSCQWKRNKQVISGFAFPRLAARRTANVER